MRLRSYGLNHFINEYICACVVPAWKICVGAIVERYDWPHTFFYMDPPYWETEGYGVPFEFQ